MRTFVSLIALVALMLVAGIGILAQDEDVAVPDRSSDDVIERGEYLVRVEASCVACHGGTGYEADPLGVALVGGQPFEQEWGVVYAPNLTLVSEWTAEEIEIAIRYGQNPDGETLLPPMAYNLHSILADQDMEAIIAYLQSLTPEGDDVPAPEFVDDFTRDTVREVPEFDLEDEFDYPEGMEDDPLVRGYYLASATSHCMGCHGAINENGEASLNGIAASELDPQAYPSLLQENIEFYPDDVIYEILADTSLVGMPTYSYQYMPIEDYEAIVAWLRAQPYTSDWETLKEENPDVTIFDLVGEAEEE